MLLHFVAICALLGTYVAALASPTNGPAGILYVRQVNGTAITACENTCDTATKDLDACDIDPNCLCGRRVIGELLSCANCALATGDAGAEDIKGTLADIKGLCATKNIDVGDVSVTASAPVVTPTQTSKASKSSYPRGLAVLFVIGSFLMISNVGF